jgi:hypothetical protein
MLALLRARDLRVLRRLAASGIALAILGVAGLALAAPLAGRVYDGELLSPIGGAVVTDSATGQRTTTGDDGRFSFADLPPGPRELTVEAEGYDPTIEAYDLLGESPDGGEAGDSLVLILFRPGISSEIIEITDSAPTPPPPGKQELRREEITRIPGSRGDALTSIKSMPGVANADAPGNGPGLLVIRGSAPEDSKITIDGIEIPVLYHFFGLQSVVPSEFIDTIEFSPGGFGAEQGRATGGFINIVTRHESVPELEGFAELSFINFAGFIQGPLWRKQNLSFAAGLRRSTIDLLLPLVLPEDANLAFTTAPQYYDGQLRIDWKPTDRDRVSMLALTSFDLLALLNDNINPNEPQITGGWENQTTFTRAIVSWTHKRAGFENRLVGSTGTSGFRFVLGNERHLEVNGFVAEVREDLAYSVTDKVRIRAGGEAKLDRRELDLRFPLPPAEGMPPTNFSTAPLLVVQDTLDQNVSGAYAAVDLQPTRTTTISAGLRLDYYHRLDEQTLSPRVQLTQGIGKDWTLRAAMGSYSRGLEYAESFPTYLDPERATQYVAGADYIVREGVTASATAFYTDRRGLVVQDARLAAENPEMAYVNRGYGRSFGTEMLLRARFKDFFGWASYTLSKSDRIDGPESDRRLFDFDQTHNFVAVGSYTLGKWELGGRWQYSTGNPLTPVDGSIYLADFNVYLPVFGAPNSTRLDAAHSLDLRIDRKWKFASWELAAYLDVTNVYAHPRVLGYQYNFDFTEKLAIEELPLVPALGVRGSF